MTRSIRVIGRFEISAPSHTKITWNTTRSNYLTYALPAPHPSNFTHFVLLREVIEIYPILIQIHRMTPKLLWKLQFHRYTTHVTSISKVQFLVCFLYDQPFSTDRQFPFDYHLKPPKKNKQFIKKKKNMAKFETMQFFEQYSSPP